MSDTAATVWIVYFMDQEPEPAPRYEDMPPWHPDDNFDNVRRRSINAAWDALLRVELKDISFRELARVSKVNPPAIYHHFKNVDALGAELAALSVLKLRKECNAALRGSKTVTRYIRAVLDFAQKRPNHFALVVSRRVPGGRELENVRKDLANDLHTALYRLLRREPTGEETTAMRIHIFGGATMVATRVATIPEVLTTLVVVLKSWRRTKHRRKAA